MKYFRLRLIIVIAVVAVAAIFVLPTIDMYVNGTKEPRIWPHKKINLGLDLQGGMHLILEVDTDKAVSTAVERLEDDLRSLMREENVRYAQIERTKNQGLYVRLKGEDHIKGFDRIIGKEFANLETSRKTPEENVREVVLSYKDQEVEHLKKMAVDQALETIRNRVDQFGVSEPDIRRQGDNRIFIQLPGIEDPDSAKELIGKTALLEFKLLDESHDVSKAIKGEVPPGTEILYQVRDNPETGQEMRTPYLVKKRTVLTGANLTDARVLVDSQYNEPYVALKFDKSGGRIFERVTGENVNKRLAIVLDDIVHSAPVIQQKISGGEARITGSFTNQEAHLLAIALRAGSLPAPVKILEERTVGPSLGHDSIKKGTWSVIMGGVLVIIFMVLYYRTSGLIADLALIFNILIIAAALAMFQATLTLPGIAGIILTVGMAVDANVLIFERIREEKRLGKTPYASMTAGFNRAALTILDANVTTLIAAVVLMQFGTGPVRGFAVTLTIGVFTSMFTALVMSRMIYDYLLATGKMKTITI